jgi:phosphotransferase system  glucose/maltose/N-acetylglucosamine-specific IIC component
MKKAVIFLLNLLLVGNLRLSAATNQSSPVVEASVVATEINKSEIKDEVKAEQVTMTLKEFEQLKEDLKKTNESFVPESIKNFAYNHRHAIAINLFGLVGAGLAYSVMEEDNDTKKKEKKMLLPITLGLSLCWWAFVMSVDGIKSLVKGE